MRGTIFRAALGGASAGLLAFLGSLGEYSAAKSEIARRAVMDHYLGLLALTNLRHATVICGIGALVGALAGLSLGALAALRRRGLSPRLEVLAGGAAFVALLVQGFLRWLVDSPESVLAFWPYDSARLDPLYDHVQPWMLDASAAVLVALLAAPLVGALALGGHALVRAGARLVERPRRLVALAPLPCAAILIPLPFVLGSSPGPRRDARPNVLVLASDTLRQDRIERLRGGEPVMPNVERLAERGTSFRSCFVPVARTTESLATLMTGAWPQRHGIRSSWTDATAFPVPAMPRCFARAGYETIAIGDWTGTDFERFDMGFERTRFPDETWALKTMVARGGRLTGLLLLSLVPRSLAPFVCPEIAYHPGVDASRPVRHGVAAELSRAARSSRPFFMQVYTGNTHAPFTPAGEHHRRFSDPVYRGPNRYGLWARTADEAFALQSAGMRARDLEQLESVYDAAARTFDDEVGAYLGLLSALGLEETTIVVVLSDHGTAFYERGSFGQGNEIVSDVSNRIPLVVVDPRREHAVHSVDRVVREVDVMPTILELAGLEVPDTCEGVSLRRYFEEPGLDMGLVAYGETGLWIGKQAWQEDELDFGFPDLDAMIEIHDWEHGTLAVADRWLRLMIRAQHRMIRTGRWKLVFVPTRSGARIRLYDVLERDSGGDVSAQHPEVVWSLLPLLQSFLAREPDVWSDPLPPAHLTRAKTAFK